MKMLLPEKYHSVFLAPEDAEAICQALATSGHLELAEKLADKAKRSETELRYASALKLWDQDTFDIDDHPVVSSGKDGAYVMIWQWITNDETGDSDVMLA
jgi:hypothetical protein